jgi:hypothetical protein
LSAFSRGGWREEKCVTPFSSTHLYILAASAAETASKAARMNTVNRRMGKMPGQIAALLLNLMVRV